MFPYQKRSSVAFRTTAIVLLTSYLPACTGYRTQEATPEQVVTTKHPDQVRITRQDGSQVVVLKPVIQGDSLVGRAAEIPDSLRQPEAFGIAAGEVGSIDSQKLHVAVALADIRAVETEEVNPGTVVIGVVLIGAVIAAVYALLKASANPF